ncbi:MAG: Uncharacterized protein Athens101410_698 [Parcubacteria group bacterium Athens1014_10]|nr:MAG: Uncharacterized protein Athens101410_698 [Parcubacteria group bacterium Athens1014_10]TSD04683.1 MAG: Uncharacterized protein Athens071412_678 [Parcubacteria group bacterium Athens0714_12]
MIIIDILIILISYFIPWCSGYLLLSLLDRKNILAFGYKFFSAFLLGGGILTYEMFLIGVLGQKEVLSNFLALNLFNLIFLESLLYFLRKKIIYFSIVQIRGKLSKIWMSFQQMEKLDKILASILLLSILFRVGMGVWQISISPSYDFDTWNNWNLRAKVIFMEQKIPLDKETGFFLGGGIRSYPMNNVLWKVWTASMLGKWDDQKINSFSVVFYLILLGLFYNSFTIHFNRRFKILGTYLLSGIPFLFFHSWVSYADLQVSVYLFFTAAALINFLNTKKDTYLHLSALGLFFTLWTKNEGLVLASSSLLLFGLIALITKAWKIRDFIIFWLAAGLISLPWLAFRSANNLGALSGDDSAFKFVFNQNFFNDWFSKIFWQSHFNFIWWLAFFVLLFKFRLIVKNFKLKYLFLFLMILFAVYNSVFLFTDQSWGMNALPRSMLHLIPLAMFALIEFLAVYFSAIYLKPKN